MVALAPTTAWLAGDYPALDGFTWPSGALCVLDTATAFTGTTDALEKLRDVLGATPYEVVSVTSRSQASDEGRVATLREAALVICLDGSPLHARSVWRRSPVGDLLTTQSVVAVGSVASVLGDVMLDPRGGAPTTGLARWRDVVVSTELSPEVRPRTTQLLRGVVLLQLAALDLVSYSGEWHVGAASVTRDGEPVRL